MECGSRAPAVEVWSLAALQKRQLGCRTPYARVRLFGKTASSRRIP